MGIAWNYNTYYIIHVLFDLHSKIDDVLEIIRGEERFFQREPNVKHSILCSPPNFRETACWVVKFNAFILVTRRKIIPPNIHSESNLALHCRIYRFCATASQWLRITYFLFSIYWRDKKGKLHHVLLNTVKSRTSFTFISKLHNKLFSA